MEKPKPRSEACAVAVASLLFTYAFFFEYLPPFRWVHVTYDLHGYHLPLLDSAFQSLWQGRFPLWDSAIYCGISLAGNLQAGLFYPPNWLVFAASIGRRQLAYWPLEALVFAHVWLAFVLCYRWLRARRLDQLPSAFGAGVFAFSGYLMINLQHFGVVCGYAWMPLGLWAIDQAAEGGRWRPLWKLVAASALCLLAGYPPTWFVFCVAAMAYALGGANRWKVTVWTALAIACSLPIAMVQLLPTWQAAAMKAAELKYGDGVRDAGIYVPYLVPNYYDFRIDAPLARHADVYSYLGVPAIFGLGWVIWRRKLRPHLPLLSVLAVTLIGLTNPFNLVWRLLSHSGSLMEICRDWYFLAGITLVAAPLAAAGLDGFLKAGGPSLPRWLTPVAACSLALWAAWELRLWAAGGAGFVVGWKSALYPAALLAPFALGLCLLRSSQGRRRAWLSGALLLAAGAEYKAFGTSQQFNARPGDADKDRASAPFMGMATDVYRKLLADVDYRVAVDPLTGPYPNSLRLNGLTTPQGMDPMMPAQYSELMKTLLRPGDLRLIDLDPSNDALFRSLGVRYFITSENGLFYQALRANAKFRLLEPSNSFHQVFEIRDPQPAWRWEPAGRSDQASAERIQWEPARRGFQVESAAGGRFILVEQHLPGWRATVDSQPAAIERWEGAFQAIRVPAGTHRIVFEYKPRALLAGALITALSLAAFCAVVLRSTPRAR
jgi:hypothetical protein